MQEVKEKIKKTLEGMGCDHIEFEDGLNSVTVFFDCKELTSFREVIEGWKYSGITIDKSGKKQYKIEFQKV